MASSKKFNWQGIRDNGDGSFTVENKAARKRILHEFHLQGVSARSKRIEGDGWKISPVGYKPFKKSGRASFDYERPYPRIRPRTIYPTRRARPYYPVQRYPGYSRPIYRAPPRIGGPSLFSGAGQKISRWRQLRREGRERERLQKIEAKKTEQELNEKMRAERIAAEREETARQIRKQELARESLAHERHEQAERMRARLGFSQKFLAPMSDQPRNLMESKKEPPKPSAAEIQKSREEYISG